MPIIKQLMTSQGNTKHMKGGLYICHKQVIVVDKDATKIATFPGTLLHLTLEVNVLVRS